MGTVLPVSCDYKGINHETCHFIRYVTMTHDVVVAQTVRASRGGPENWECWGPIPWDKGMSYLLETSPFFTSVMMSNLFAIGQTVWL